MLRALAKYGPSLTHAMAMYRRLMEKGIDCEVEFAVDETDYPTKPAEHVVVVSELQRLGMDFVSFAPRFVGRFEKGVEHIGDLDELKRDFEVHAEIARTLGPYKLSLHSGSDKYSTYPLIAEATQGMVHLKTAGTSWAEALRVIAHNDPDLMREVLALALDSFEANRKSYHLSCDPTKIPTDPTDEQVARLMDVVDSRQVLHVGLRRHPRGVRPAAVPGLERPRGGTLRHHRRPLREAPAAVRAVRAVAVVDRWPDRCDLPEPTARVERCEPCGSHSRQDMRTEQVPSPRPRAGEIRIAVGYVGICRSDLHYFADGAAGIFAIREPLIPGHEVSGVIDLDPTGELEAGTPVTVHPATWGVPQPDLTEEQRHLWPDGGYLGSASTWPHTSGGLAEQLVVRRDQIRRLASLPVRRAVLAEPLAVGLHGLAIGGRRLGSARVSGSPSHRLRRDPARVSSPPPLQPWCGVDALILLDVTLECPAPLARAGYGQPSGRS